MKQKVCYDIFKTLGIESTTFTFIAPLADLKQASSNLNEPNLSLCAKCLFFIDPVNSELLCKPSLIYFGMKNMNNKILKQNNPSL